MKNLRITGHRVLVKPKEVEKVTESGIIIQQQSKYDEKLLQHKMLEGTVLQVGPTAYTNENVTGSAGPWCKVGDRVYYKQYSGKFIPDPNSDKEEASLILLNDEDIIAVIEDKEDE